MLREMRLGPGGLREREISTAISPKPTAPAATEPARSNLERESVAASKLGGAAECMAAAFVFVSLSSGGGCEGLKPRGSGRSAG